MARKKKKNWKPPTDLVQLEASTRKLQSLLTHPDMSYWVYSGAAAGVRSKLLQISFETLRNIVHRVPLINAVLNTRIAQIQPFCRKSTEQDQKGYKLEPVEDKLQDDDTEKALYQFVEQTGYQFNDDREDDFMDYVQMMIREVLTVDQIATEIQRNRLGEVIAFWLLDGVTIHRTTEESHYPKNVRFVQMVDQKVYNQYTSKNLIFDYKNKRADLRFRGFGYSEVEMTIDLITTLLFGYRYLQDQFVRDKIPKGFISVMGDIDRTQIQAIQEYWYAAMSGAGGRWNIPILPSGKEGVGIDFKSIQPSNKDMEYHKSLMFISSILGAVFNMDLAEMGIKTDDSQALIGESGKPRIEASKDRGLGMLLSFTEQHMNKILRKITANYKFRFIGWEPAEEIKRVEIDSKKIKSYMTVDEIREIRGKEPFDEDWSKVVLDAQAVQIYQSGKQAEQAEAMEGEGTEEGAKEEEGFGGNGESESEADWETIFKSKTDQKEKTIRIVIE